MTSIHLFLTLSSILVILAIHISNGVPLNSEISSEVNLSINDHDHLSDYEQLLTKRRLPIEGILIGRRATFPNEGIMIGKRHSKHLSSRGSQGRYPNEGILIGKRDLGFISSENSI